MESVGEQLRQERLRQGLTLEDVCASTRISLKNLEAIENDDVSQISSPFFYRSFARQFAERLGLEFSKLAEAVQSRASEIPAPVLPVHFSAPLPKVPPIRPMRGKISRSVLPVIALVAVLAGCSRVYAMWEGSRSSLQASLTSFVESLSGNLNRQRPEARNAKVSHHPAIRTALRVGSPAIEISKNENPEAAPNSVPCPPGAIEKDATAAIAENRDPNLVDDSAQNGIVDLAPSTNTVERPGFRVEVAAIERTWLSIVADEKEVYSGVLEASQTKILEGRESARIRTGNAGGVNIVFNGKTIGSLGERGQVRTVVFTKDNYEIVEPSPEIALTSFSPSAE